MVDPQIIREEYSKDLRDFATLIAQQISEICSDVGPLLRASEMCLTDWKNGTFHYELGRLNFRVSSYKKNHIPKDLFDITVTLSGNVRYLFKAISCEELIDPLNWLEFNLILNGSFKDGGQLKNAQSCWHLDRDEEEGRDNQAYIHPFYHFQSGGRNLNQGWRFGRYLIIDTPRIAHPPMDAILGVDFVLTNFVEKENITALRENPTYKRIVHKAQNRIWKPYFLTLARAWEVEDSNKWYSQMLFPQIIKL